MSINEGGPVLTKGNYRVSINGFPVGYWKDAKIPTIKHKSTVVPQAGANIPRQQPSGMAEKPEDAEFTAYQGTDGLMETAIRNWFLQCLNLRTGRASGPPQAAFRDVTVEQFDIDGRVVHEWRLRQCFPLETGGLEFAPQDEAPVERKLKLAVNIPEQVR
jgi:hypothetical protein